MHAIIYVECIRLGKGGTLLGFGYYFIVCVFVLGEGFSSRSRYVL